MHKLNPFLAKTRGNMHLTIEGKQIKQVQYIKCNVLIFSLLTVRKPNIANGYTKQVLRSFFFIYFGPIPLKKLPGPRFTIVLNL